MDPVRLSIFANRIEAVCDEMGAALRRAAFSPNIRDRLDYSCAVFDPEGQLCAQAAHIPVHLGSMAFAMAGIVKGLEWAPGDMIILNDPFKGGTHLPDITLVAPVFTGKKKPSFFVANRAHHADVGGMTSGSMPLSTTIFQEGIIIPPLNNDQIIKNRYTRQNRFAIKSFGTASGHLPRTKRDVGFLLLVRLRRVRCRNPTY